MRRSRIKAMASVPPRRKPAKDARAEKDEKPEAATGPDATNGDGGPVDGSREAEGIERSPEGLVHKEEEEEAKGTFIRAVDSPKNANEFDSDVTRAAGVGSPPENVEAGGDERAAESGKSLAFGASGEEGSDVAARVEPERAVNAEGETGRPETTDVAEPKGGSVALENAPMTKQLSQTRASFMRPSPRLDGGGSRIRRNSVHGSGASASESEDDCHRRGAPGVNSALANRVRNDSAGSAHSPNKAETTTSHRRNLENLPNAKTASITTSAKNSSSSEPRQKRKINVSESARKLAEARREFFLKYEHKQPDRTKLTMYDLIYYNPVTNPIKRADSAITNAPRNTTAPSTTRMGAVEEGADEDEDDECDVGDAMPVPQVKVGPDGHLVLDERSLVIEHTGAEKNRQALARTEALVDDDSNGNGFYKKRQKTRDWPKWETLKFYKALNTVGTDFLLMQSLFPERTRKEIKMKFKKEEKLNRRFVEKALVYHQEFNIESLQQDLASFEGIKSRESETAQCEKSTGRRCNAPKRTNNKSRRLTALSIDEAIQEPAAGENVERVTTESVESRTTLTKVEKKRQGKRRATSPASSSSSSSSSSNEIGTGAANESESEPEVYIVKPTRSGRYSKTRKLQAPAINTLDNLFSDPDRAGSSAGEYTDEDEEEEENEEEEDDEGMEDATSSMSRRCNATTAGSISDIGRVVPGSLVIVSRESADEPGETLLQVYMVSSDIENPAGCASGPSMTPVKLTPELLDTVTAGINNVDPISVDDD